MTKDRVCANTPALSRRTLLAGLPASGAALAFSAAEAHEPDPVVTLYHEWLAARRDWRKLAKMPGNEDFDDPRSVAAQNREETAEREMMAVRPTSPDGITALVALAWSRVEPGTTNPKEYAEQAQDYECSAILALWKACTGQDGYPVI